MCVCYPAACQNKHLYIWHDISPLKQLFLKQDDQTKRKESCNPEERTPPTCTKSLGHEPFKARADFSSVKIIMVKRFNSRNNESLFPVAGLAQVPHVQTPGVSAAAAVLHSSEERDDILPKEFTAPKCFNTSGLAFLITISHLMSCRCNRTRSRARLI